MPQRLKYAVKMTNMHSLRFGIFLAAGLACISGCGGGGGGSGTGNGVAQGRYTIADAVATALVSTANATVAGPNNAGQVVGPATGLNCGGGAGVPQGSSPAMPNGCYTNTPFLITPGQAVKTFNTTGALQAINNNGDIIGVGPGDTSFVVHNGTVTLLGNLGGPLTQIAAINDAGQVIGTSLTTQMGNVPHAFEWLAGQMSDIGGLPGYKQSEALGINSAGHIVGDSDGPGETHAALWHEGKVDDLGIPSGANPPGQFRLSVAVAINTADKITGYSVYGYVYHAITWQNSVTTDLGPGIPSCIDESGNVYGESLSQGTDGTSYHATEWVGTRAVDLNTVIDSNSGWILENVTGVNSKGQISGCGLHNGTTRTFVLTPKTVGISQ